MRRPLLFILLWVLGATPLFADLTFPASFEVVEESADQFRLTLTVPLIKGRYMKVRMVVPAGMETDQKPEARTGNGSLTRDWRVPADASLLPGSVFGLSGLLGTPYEVKFLLSTLDGRRHEAVLRSTAAVLVVPQPPTPAALASRALLDGMRRAICHPALWLLLLALLWTGRRLSFQLGSVIVAAVAGLLGHQIVLSTVPPVLLMSVAGLPAACALLVSACRQQSGPRPLSLLRGAILAAGVGLLSGWAGLLLTPTAGLSFQELHLCTALLAVGWAVGGMGVAAVLVLANDLLPTRVQRWLRPSICVVATAWALYHAAGLIQLYGPGWGDTMFRTGKWAMRIWVLPFMTDWSMGRIRLPLPALVLLVVGLVCVVRSRRAKASRGRRALCAILLPAALLIIPLAPWRATNPFYVPQPLSAAEARPLVSGLLTETYLAFNLASEEAAFDALAKTLADELIADVYLDSRRRLTEGIRKGATVTVKDVTVTALEMLSPEEPDARALYRCQWTVLARVEHWQHTHLRRNSYVGTIGVAAAEGNWRIAQLELTDEQREIISVGIPKL
jgi:hypothetical protein